MEDTLIATGPGYRIEKPLGCLGMMQVRFEAMLFGIHPLGGFRLKLLDTMVIDPDTRHVVSGSVFDKNGVRTHSPRVMAQEVAHLKLIPEGSELSTNVVHLFSYTHHGYGEPVSYIGVLPRLTWHYFRKELSDKLQWRSYAPKPYTEETQARLQAEDPRKFSVGKRFI